MSWSFSASGTKEEAKAQLAQAKINPESHDAAEHGAALACANALVDASPDDDKISVSANGHTDDKAQKPARYTGVSISFGSNKT